MHPTYKVIVDGEDITPRLDSRLMEIRLTDEVGWFSDTMTMIVDDAGGRIKLPKIGKPIQVQLGYEETGITRVGDYIIDEAKISGPPDQMLIRARSVDMCQQMKTLQRRSWDQKTLGEMIEKIAGQYGLRHRVSPELASIFVDHIEQNSESDIHFLTRLARQYNAVWKAISGHLIFITSQEGKTPQGTPLPVFKIHRTGVTAYELAWAERSNLKHVTAYWRDRDKALLMPETAGDSGQPGKILQPVYPDAGRAKAAAQAELTRLQQQHKELCITMPGNLTMIAESPVQLTNEGVSVSGRGKTQSKEHHLWRDGYPGDYTVHWVEHCFKGNGYTTTFRAR
ncbi:Phage late control gene D protein (GPD) [Vibrio aerogenes CECT 7868]|uniref:Phage late control gene D protein (GPD) n=1 Tax=Vibrio aerogenes CECT 7868 TaxID=1216006 RepID=A0A1M5Z9P2_9VIBR|nr:contractile injection system protein, VgrG/Pvc8 family [Vibrio aerogenes]SHI20838.1 Phage late control gene D protein (GPD) [Vibrio aerogenes CECT 7868]